MLLYRLISHFNCSRLVDSGWFSFIVRRATRILLGAKSVHFYSQQCRNPSPPKKNLCLFSLLHKLQDVNQRAATRRCLPVIETSFKQVYNVGVGGGLLPWDREKQKRWLETWQLRNVWNLPFLVAGKEVRDEQQARLCNTYHLFQDI